MSKFKTCLYSNSQVLTRKHVFFSLTGQKTFEPYKDEKDTPVFLNFNDDLYRAANMFTTLSDKKVPVIVYSDVPVNPVIQSFIAENDQCSMIICPDEYELEKASDCIRSGKTYRSACSLQNKHIEVPCGAKNGIKLTDIQKAVLFNLVCGVPNKTMAYNLHLTEKYISKTITRLKEIFGGCESTAQLVANASLML